MYSEQLTSIPLFKGITEQELPEILFKLNARIIQCLKGQEILLDSDDVGIVLQGRINIVREVPGEAHTLLIPVQKHELFGAASAGPGPGLSVGVSESGARFTFSAAAISNILMLSYTRIMPLCVQNCRYHCVVVNLVQMLNSRNMQLLQWLNIISRKTIREKLMAWLQYQTQLHQSRDFTIPPGFKELAACLGVNRHNLSTEPALMESDGQFVRNHHRFTLPE